MIRLDKLKSLHESTWKKEGLFREGKVYIGRKSKNGENYVIRDDKGNWININNKEDKFLLLDKKYALNFKVLLKMIYPY